MYYFFDVFIGVADVVATALYFDVKGHMQCHDIWKNPKCINLYRVRETSGYSQLSLRRTPLGPAVNVRLREMSVL